MRLPVLSQVVYQLSCGARYRTPPLETVNVVVVPIRNGVPLRPTRPINASSRAPESGVLGPLTVVVGWPAAVSDTPASAQVPAPVTVTAWPAVSVTPDDCQSVSTPLAPGGGIGLASTVTVVEPGGTTSASCVTVKLRPESVIVSVRAEPVFGVDRVGDGA